MRTVIMFATVMLLISSVYAVDLIKDGKPLAKIYVDKFDDVKILPENRKLGSLPKQKQYEVVHGFVINDLNYHLEKMSGAKLEIVVTSNPDEIKSPAIVLGSLANRLGAKPEKNNEINEAFRLKVEGGKVLIGGETDKSQVYGIYALLEKLGCEWVMPGPEGEVIPSMKTVTVNEMDFTQVPSFALRSPWYSGGSIVPVSCRQQFNIWKLRQKMQIIWLPYPLQMYGGHVWLDVINHFSEEFKKHPEYLAAVRQPDGSLKRKKPQLETTNPQVVEFITKYVEREIKRFKIDTSKKFNIGIGPYDGTGFSESAESTAAGSGKMDPLVGEPDVSDLVVLLSNQVLDRLREKYPNLYLGYYVYSVHASFPYRYKPDPRIVFTIADITYSRLHAIEDKNSPTRSLYKRQLEKFGELHKTQGNILIYRGFNWNLADNFLPFTKVKVWGEAMPYYHKLGFSGLYPECSKAWSLLAPSDFVLAKLAWNVNQDWRKLLKHYCEKAYGKAAPFMEQYNLMLIKNQHGAGREAGSYHSFALIYGPDFIEKAKKLFDQAEAAADTKADLTRVKYARIPLEMLQLYLGFRKAYCDFNFKEAEVKYHAMLDRLDYYYKENPNLVDIYATRYIKRFLQQFVEKSNKYSSGDYRIVYRLPEKLPTMFDQFNRGHEMSYYNPEINDQDYLKTSTYSTTWESQGLAGYRSGSVWYRAHFKLPQDLKDKPIGLFIGGVDSIVRVWCNGEYIGEGHGFSKPFEFDLTGIAKSGQDNLLAIQVQRLVCAELGTGGMIYPSYIFTGPRLKERAPVVNDNERVLPGGAREVIKE